MFKSINYTYDNLNRLIKVDYGNGNAITYTYDAGGNRTQVNVTAVAATDTITVNGAGVNGGTILETSGGGVINATWNGIRP